MLVLEIINLFFLLTVRNSAEASNEMYNKMSLQLLQLVLRISIYSEIFFFWCDSLFKGLFPLQSTCFLKFKTCLVKYFQEISLAWMYRCLNFYNYFTVAYEIDGSHGYHYCTTSFN